MHNPFNNAAKATLYKLQAAAGSENESCCEKSSKKVIPYDFAAGQAEPSQPPLCAHQLKDYDSQIIYLNMHGERTWYFGKVHYRGDNSYVNLAVDCSENEEGEHSAAYPFHPMMVATFCFRATTEKEYQGLKFSYDDFITP